MAEGMGHETPTEDRIDPEMKSRMDRAGITVLLLAVGSFILGIIAAAG